MCHIVSLHSAAVDSLIESHIILSSYSCYLILMICKQTSNTFLLITICTYLFQIHTCVYLTAKAKDNTILCVRLQFTKWLRRPMIVRRCYRNWPWQWSSNNVIIVWRDLFWKKNSDSTKKKNLRDKQGPFESRNENICADYLWQYKSCTSKTWKRDCKMAAHYYITLLYYIILKCDMVSVICITYCSWNDSKMGIG